MSFVSGTSKLALGFLEGNAASLPWCGTSVWKRQSVSLQANSIEACSGIFGRATLRRCHGVEQACGNDRAWFYCGHVACRWDTPQTNTSELDRSALPVGILHTVCQHTDTGGGCDIVAVREAPDWYLDDGIQYLKAFRRESIALRSDHQHALVRELIVT
jgi:hypothetical protein